MMQVKTIAGYECAYVDTGEPIDGGPTVLLVHGFPLSHLMWQSQIEDLASTCRVVAPDLRGFGDSTLGNWPAENEEPSLDRYADDLSQLLEAIQPSGPIVFVGFSMGGYLGWSFMQSHASLIQGLALLDTRAKNDDPEGREKRLKMARGVSKWGSARVAEMMRPALFGKSATVESIEQTTAVIASTDPQAIAASQRAMAARPDSTSLLRSLSVPTLVLVGEEDTISPLEEMRDIAEAIPAAQFVAIPKAGHMAPVEQPKAVSDALRAFALSLC